jgi:hypothetical protein
MSSVSRDANKLSAFVLPYCVADWPHRQADPGRVGRNSTGYGQLGVRHPGSVYEARRPQLSGTHDTEASPPPPYDRGGGLREATNVAYVT